MNVNDDIFETYVNHYTVIFFSVKSKKENKVVNFGFEMSECFKRSKPLPCIVEHDVDDSPSIFDVKELMLEITRFHDHDKVHIGSVKQKLGQILCLYYFT